MTKRIALLFSLVLVLAMVAAGCGDDKDKKTSESTPTLEKVSFQLYWMPEISSSPFYAAQKEGYFQDENLDVELVQGGYDADGNYIEVLPLVLSGQADFGEAGSDQILLARSRGEPVVAIAALLQRNPTGFYSLAEKQIHSPEDLKGKRLWIWGEDLSYQMFFLHTGLTSADVTEITDEEVDYNLLFNDEVDAMIGWVHIEAIDLRYQGHDVNFMLFNDYGVAFYADLVFTTERMIQEKPEVVQAFVNALMRGMDYTIEQPDTMAEYTVTQYGDQLSTSADVELNRQALQAVVPLIDLAGSRPGMMDLDIWQITHDDMLALGHLTEPLDLTQAFDLSFVEAYYAAQDD